MKEKNQERRLGQFLVNNKAIVIFLFLAIVLSFATDNFMTKTNLLNMVRQVCVMSVMSVGFTLILASGSIDLSVGYMLGLVGVFCALISKIAGLPVILVLLFSILFGMFLGFCNAFLFLTFKMPPFIVTLSTAQIFRGVTHLLCDGTPVSGLPDAIIAIGQDYFLGIPVQIYIMVIVAVVMAVFLRSTYLGRHAIAMGGNEEAARVSGVHVKRMRYIVYIIMGACVAIAAIIMDGRVASAQPTAGAGMEMDAIAAVVIGGTPLSGGYGNVLGSVFGCLIVGLINNGLNILNVSSYWQWIAKGALIIIAIMLDVQTSSLIKATKKRKA
ncbi:ABC transporter permease [Diplocloster agilis]|uniref:ABC transporter permease n=1 Tax=Diplocloster agilis TaxID=2850323 RepID=A0A949JUB5_9FIRM|nr:ABC transporter permease [Diplocloster agilis]MBU9735263.1 ABC transporter permease [Diplocloster agilis]MBU9743662.1 ABC transporter permease [Diplocloster agilis]